MLHNVYIIDATKYGDVSKLEAAIKAAAGLTGMRGCRRGRRQVHGTARRAKLVAILAHLLVYYDLKVKHV